MLPSFHGTDAGVRELAQHLKQIQDERRLAEEALGKVRAELARLSRVASMGALTASIAHEVSQPLAGIVTNASTCMRLLTSDPPRVEEALGTLTRALRDAERTRDVIARLRSLFSNQSTASDLVNVNEAVHEVLALSSSELRQNLVVVRTELADELPAVSGDRVQLQQVVMNLVLNASEAMSGIEDRPRQLVIRTRHDTSDGVLLSVQDAGIGLSTGVVEMLFDAFYTTKTNGMGVGLSVSRSIIERHGGRLWATPNAPDPGATFSFSVPIRID